MKKLSVFLMCSCIAFLAGCQSTGSENSKPSKIAQDAAFYISVENVGVHEGTEYTESPAELSKMIERNLRLNTENIKVHEGSIAVEDAKEEAKKAGSKYLISSKIITWKDSPAGEDKEKEKARIETTIWDLENNSQVDLFRVYAKDCIENSDIKPCCTVENSYKGYFKMLFRK